MPSSSTTTVSKCTIYPNQKSSIKPLKLSVSDLPMLSCHYIQKGILLSAPPYSSENLIHTLKTSLSIALSHFPPLAGRLTTDSDGYIYITCNDAGVDFVHSKAKHLTLNTVLSPSLIDVHPCFKEFFAYDLPVSYSGHNIPLAAVQVTELADVVFIVCTINHSVTDGTSFWHFFNTFAAVTKKTTAAVKISKPVNSNYRRSTMTPIKKRCFRASKSTNISMGSILSALVGDSAAAASQSSESSGHSVKTFHSSARFQVYQNEIKDSPRLVVIYFSATWCGPCKIMEPILHALSNEFPDVDFVKIDVDELSDVAQEFKVQAMPTFLLLKNGSVDEKSAENDVRLGWEINGSVVGRSEKHSSKRIMF